MAAKLFKDFTFNNTAETLYKQVLAVADFAGECGVLPTITDGMKPALTELLTNAVKHSGAISTLLKISITDTEIIISKTDWGKPLVLEILGKEFIWPLPDDFKKEIISIYNDFNCTLKAKLQHSNRVTFFVEDFDETHHMPDIGDVTEHFGLLIIASACKTFEYHYDTAGATNNFIATISRQRTI